MNQRKTILLVEDDEAFRTSMRKVLERENYRILEAASGEEGRVISQDQEIDLIILDFYLGDMTGADFLDGLPDAPPVMVLSANVGTEIDKKVRERGAKITLTKPIKREHLLLAVKSCMGLDLDDEGGSDGN
ncbi:MAG: response regulator [Candidatus Omnitrophica bacterium]|nr:response regulator [Candidatus Omnitrophota bacterium]